MLGVVVVVGVAAVGRAAALARAVAANPGGGAPVAVGPPDGVAARGGLLHDRRGHALVWDRCGPITWVVRRGPGPADAVAVAAAAVEQLRAATAFTFVFGGTTEKLIASGDGGAERTLHISWATPAELADLVGSVAGVGGQRYRIEGNGPPRVYAGYAVVDSTGGLATGFDGGASEGAVLLHELGHAMGLAHVDNPGLLMAPSMDAGLSAAYQPGDLAALAGAVDDRPCA